jgi:galactonate dehydratase
MRKNCIPRIDASIKGKWNRPLKIAELRTFVVGNPPPRYGGRYFLLLKLVTDNGIEGLGEVYAASFRPRAMIAMIEDVFEQHVLGADPFRIEALWRNVYGRGYSQRPDISLMGVLSGIEMALWDIVGKAVDKPVYALLGGKVHERLRTYTYLYPDEPGADAYSDSAVYRDPDAAAARALRYLAQGFTAVKFDPAGPYSAFDPRQPSLERLSLSEAFCKTLRAAVGSRCDLLFGTHGQFTTSGAIRLARRLEAYDPLWFEEPTPPEVPEEMARVAAQTTIPIATGERLTAKYEFSRVLETKAASILQMNLGRVGGLLEAKKIAGMAEAHYAQIAPHLYCGPVVGAANIQLATCSPNFLILESIERWDGFQAQLLKTPIRWEDGYVIPPTSPGLGVEIDEDVALAHPYAGEELHLVPATKPVGPPD